MTDQLLEHTDADPVKTVRLDITGMTCAACAARIEKKLNRLDGVEATVNYATEQANVRLVNHVAIPVDPDDLIEVVSSMGYGASVRLPPQPQISASSPGVFVPTQADVRSAEQERRVAELRQRLLVSTLLSGPVLVLSMAPPLQFENWQWLALT